MYKSMAVRFSPQSSVHRPSVEQSAGGLSFRGAGKTWPRKSRSRYQGPPKAAGHSESTKPGERRDIHAPQVACKSLAGLVTKGAQS